VAIGLCVTIGFTVQLSEAVDRLVKSGMVKSQFASGFTAKSSTGVRLGLILSSTVTVAMQVAWLPLLSVTVSVTVFGPISLQSNAVVFSDKLAMPQASLEPLSIPMALVIVPVN